MRKLLFLLLALFVEGGIFGQSVVNEPNAQVRNVSGFHALHVATGIQLYLVQGNEEKVVVSASEPEFRDKIRTEIKDGVLSIYYKNDVQKWFDVSSKRLRAYVSCKDLSGLDASSGAKVEVEGTLKSANLAMSFSSGAKFNGKVEANVLSIDGSSGAKAELSGTAGDLKADASSGSKLSGFDLSVAKCNVSVSSGAHIDISVIKEMSASAHSGGHITYTGEGVIRDVHTGSGGGVSRR